MKSRYLCCSILSILLFCAPLTVLAAHDIAVLKVDAADGTYAPGDTLPIEITIKNNGDDGGKGTIVWYASTDSTISTSDTELGNVGIKELAPNSTIIGHWNPSLRASIADGSYFIGAIINTSGDSNIANNTGVDNTPITVTYAGGFVINNGLNDTWKNPGTPKQGFFVTVFPDTSIYHGGGPVMFVGWFTYDIERPVQGVTALLGEPGHRWLTAYGPYSHDTATLDIELTQGGVFDSGVPDPTQEPYGTMTVKFTSCSAGVVTYDIPSVGVSGTVPIERVANDNVALCESLGPPLQQNP